jgi:hypothetical protein
LAGKGIRRRPASEAPFNAACVVDSVSFVIGASAAHIVNVGMTFLDASGNVIAQKAAVDVYLASAADGLTEASAPDGLAIGTNGVFVTQQTNLSGKVVCNASGLADLNVTKTAGGTYYLAAVMPDGKLVLSSAIVVT